MTVKNLTPAVQYANSVIQFSSQWGVPQWSAEQVLGIPNVATYSDDANAWASSSKNGTIETLTLGFGIPVHASGVTIRETLGNGFVTKIEVLSADNKYSQVWNGIDTATANVVADFTANFSPTPFLVKGVRLTINTDHVEGWEEIDSVALIGNPNASPTGKITIIGNPTEKQTLTIENTLNDADGLGTFHYQWLQNGKAISNATQDNYTLDKTDVGKKISVQVSYTDDLGTLENVTSNVKTIQSTFQNSLIGSEKNDSITGSTSADILQGNAGFDTLTGGLGVDIFVLTSIKDAPLSHSKIEIMTDFSHREGDKIDLSAIDADTSKVKDQPFSTPVIGSEFSGIFTKAGQLFFDTTDHVLYGSINNVGTANFAIQLNGVTSLVASDFIL